MMSAPLGRVRQWRRMGTQKTAIWERSACSSLKRLCVHREGGVVNTMVANTNRHEANSILYLMTVL